MPNHKNRITLKNNGVLEYKNGNWTRNGKRMSISQINNYKLYDNGYYKGLTSDGNLIVLDVNKNGKPNKHNYIGGTRKQTHEKYWNDNPIVRHATDSIANEYGLNPNVLRNRLNLEGFTDLAIIGNNNRALAPSDMKNDYPKTSDYNFLNANSEDLGEFVYDNGRIANMNGFQAYGLDDVGTMIKEGKVKLINEKYRTGDAINEKGRIVHSVDGLTQKDNIGITAASLKYFRNKAAKDFPNSNNTFLDNAAGIYYNRGETGGKKYLKKF